MRPQRSYDAVERAVGERLQRTGRNDESAPCVSPLQFGQNGFLGGKTKNDHFGRQRQKTAAMNILVISIHSSFPREKGEKVSIPSVTRHRRPPRPQVAYYPRVRARHARPFGSACAFAKP